MENIKNLTVVFTGNTTSLSTAFTKVAAEGDALNTKLRGVNAESEVTGGKFAGMAGKIGASFAAIGLVVAGTSMKMAADFQQQMTYIRTDAGDTTDNIDQMSQAILHMTSQFDATTLAEGMYHLASLGLRGADAMKALGVASNMAAVGNSNLEDTATALGGALVSGIKGVQNYSAAAGTLDAIIGAGNMRMQDLVGAIGTGVLPVFKNAGLSITDFGAALATLTDNGQQADAAATHLRMTIALMEAPSQKAQGILAELGMTQTQLAMDMQTKGLVPALTDLKKHLLDTYGTTAEGKVKIAQALTEMFGGGRSSAAIQTLIDQLGRVGTKEKQIGQQTGEFSNKVKEQMMTPMALAKTAINKVKSAMDELGMGINNFITGHLTPIEAAFKKVNGFLNTMLMPSLKALGNTIETKLGPSLVRLMPTLKILAIALGVTIVAAIWVLVNVLNIVIGVLSKLIQIIENVVKWVIKLVTDIYNATKGLAGAVASGVAGVYNAFISPFRSAWKYIQGIVSDIKGAVQDVEKATGSIGHAAGNVGHAGNNVLNFLNPTKWFASGTDYAPGGMAVVGEKGPELVNLPRGSQVLTNSESQKITNNRSVTIGTIVLASADAVKEMFNQIDRDSILVSKGLSPARGM